MPVRSQLKNELFMKRKAAFVLVTTTVKNRAEARRLAKTILNARLAACIQWTPIHSLYWWKGVVEAANEYLLLAKTRRELANQLTGLIRSHHSYEVPEITFVPIEGGLSQYLEWIKTETRPSWRSARKHQSSKP